MNVKSVFCLLTGCALLITSLSGIISQVQAQQPVRFVCAQGVDPKTKQTYPTTYAITDRGKIPVVRWNYKWFGDKDTVIQGRCQVVSSTLQAAYDNGSLSYITNGTSGGQPVICSTSHLLGTCVTVLLALRSFDDSLEAVTELKKALGGHSSRLPLPRFSIIPQIYFSLDMAQFLATAPVDN